MRLKLQSVRLVSSARAHTAPTPSRQHATEARVAFTGPAVHPRRLRGGNAGVQRWRPLHSLRLRSLASDISVAHPNGAMPAQTDSFPPPSNDARSGKSCRYSRPFTTPRRSLWPPAVPPAALRRHSSGQIGRHSAKYCFRFFASLF